MQHISYVIPTSNEKEITLKVYAENGESKTIKLKIVRAKSSEGPEEPNPEEKPENPKPDNGGLTEEPDKTKSNNNKIKSLIINKVDGGPLATLTSSEIPQLNGGVPIRKTVPSSTKTITLNIGLEDYNKAKVLSSITYNLKDGDNPIDITIQAENGEKRTIRLIINKLSATTHEHDYTTVVATTGNKHIHKCACGYTNSFGELKSKGAEGHGYYCSVCDKYVVSSSHTYDSLTGKCKYCDYTCTQHTYSVYVTTTGNKHIHKCACGYTSSFGELKSKGADGHGYYCSVCNDYVISVDVHTASKYVQTGNRHAIYCSCGYNMGIADHTLTSYTNKTSTQHTAKCKYCTYSTTVGHSYTKTVVTTTGNKHIHKCDCGYTSSFGELKSKGADGHGYYCSVCSDYVTFSNHTVSKYVQSGSIHVKYCSCGYSIGSAEAHDFKTSSGKCVCGATHTHSYTLNCKLGWSGKTRCSVCGYCSMHGTQG